jgi:hypothetical protein
MSDIVELLEARQMMQYVRGTGDSFEKVITVPDPLCQQAAAEIKKLRSELVIKDASYKVALAERNTAWQEAKLLQSDFEECWSELRTEKLINEQFKRPAGVMVFNPDMGATFKFRSGYELMTGVAFALYPRDETWEEMVMEVES